MIKRQHVVSDFFEDAEAMREVLDARFNDPYTDSIPWYYFCDPGIYAYLRAAPQKVFPKPLFDRFMHRLRLWCIDDLGLVPMNLPFLHLMVNGCKLALHSDFHNGAWGYVYSLTRWDQRKFSGGETLLLRDGVPSYKKHHVHAEVLYELIPARFNQLLVFDDRIVHGTPAIEGSMNPLEARIAMVGHIRATSPVVSGSLQPEPVRRRILEAMPHLQERLRSYKDVQGTTSYRLEVAGTGVVQSATVLTDNVVTQLTGYDRSDAVASVKMLIQRTLNGLRFPAADGASTIIVPILIPIPELRPIEFTLPLRASTEAVAERFTKQVAESNGFGLKGNWEGRTFFVQEPIAGSIRIESHEAAVSFDPPMWVPSQRESFQRTLSESLNSVAAS